MPRDAVLFDLGYSIRLEKMQASFLGRVDRASNFLQMMLGAAVIASAWPIPTGIAVSALAAFSFVYQPGAKATEARAQKQRYEKLLAKESELSDQQLKLAFGDIQATDSYVMGALVNPAFVAECVRLGRPTDHKLTKYESIIAFIAGDLVSA
ncbi:hypothetical protein [Herbaspirillum frisingense]|uniref:Uncharacterized protein n=1 Tax=Herbaspirillum frisingense TaxID=92645 RepID=A0ABU1PJB3_9BURK|nr:hypothetical protein [Herbaspirillum frisingense]MDR6585542.1 hypothetical protein [Herbaspirillum frisingense]